MGFIDFSPVLEFGEDLLNKGGGGGSPSAQFATAQQLFDEAVQFSKEQFPLAFGAREAGLAGLPGLEIGPEFFDRFQLGEFGEIGPEFFEGFQLAPFEQVTPQFFEQFGPTSLEEASTDAFFADRLEKAQRQALQIASLSGIEQLGPELFTREIGPTISNIGQFLSGRAGQRAGQALNRQTQLADVGFQRALQGLTRQGQLSSLGQRRGELSLAGREQGILSQLGIDPFSQFLTPFTNVSQPQANLQSAANFQQQLQEAQNKAAGISSLGALLGGGAGFALGGPGGAALGASLGGSASTLFGGSGSPVGFQDALSFAFPQGGGSGGGFGGFGGTFGGFGKQSGAAPSTLPVF